VAPLALILRYQARAYWRRLLTTGRVQSSLTLFALLGGWLAIGLPPRLSDAATALAAGEPGRMDTVLLLVLMLNLLVLTDDAVISLSAPRLRKFPLTVSELLRVRILSVFCSPVAWLLLLASSATLYSLRLSPHALLAGVSAMLLFSLTLALGFTVSHVMAVASTKRKFLVPAAIVVVVLGAYLLVQGPRSTDVIRDAVLAVNPARLVTTIALARAPSQMLVPVAALIVASAAMASLLVWSFRRSLTLHSAQRGTPRAARALSVPGRLGGLVEKEQHDVRTVLDLWLGVLIVLSASVASLVIVLPPIFRVAIVVLVFLLNINVTINCFGSDRPSSLCRYRILPIRGSQILLAKNVALTLMVGVQLSPLMLIGLWQHGVGEVAVEVVVATVLLLTHLAWGNFVSIAAPLKMRPHRFAPNGSILTALASMVVGSAPGVTLIGLFYSEEPARWSVAAIVTVAIGAYVGSLHYAGQSFERRVHIISGRLT
jgi:hypothetical protein